MDANKAGKDFEKYFCVNYPPDTIITNPSWHAPKIFRAAVTAIASAIPDMPEEPNYMNIYRSFGQGSETMNLVRYADALKKRVIALETEIERMKVHDV